MAYCIDEIGEYMVAPVLVSSCSPDPCLLETTFCTPYLPRCSKKPIICQEIQPQSKCCAAANKNSKLSHNCCSDCSERPVSPNVSNSPTCHVNQECCNSCCKSPCKPVKTKYVIPCYRYEDGRIERYVPTRHGRLPKSVYSRNGIQDQIHGYRGAIRFLCAGHNRNDCYVYTAIEPIRRIYPKITQEMLPINQPTALMRRACEVAVGNKKRRKPFIESSYSADPDQEVRRYVSQDDRGNCCYHLEKKKHDCCPARCWSSQSCPKCEDCVRAKAVSSGNSYYYICSS